jgi:hypothetical protein
VLVLYALYPLMPLALSFSVLTDYKDIWNEEIGINSRAFQPHTSSEVQVQKCTLHVSYCGALCHKERSMVAMEWALPIPLSVCLSGFYSKEQVDPRKDSNFVAEMT